MLKDTKSPLIKAGWNTVVPDDFQTFVRVNIGHFTSLASGISIVSGQHPWVASDQAVSNFPLYEYGYGDYPHCFEVGQVTIGSDVWIGESASIVDGLTVNHGAIVAAHTHVVKEVQPFEVVGGNPSKTLGFRFTAEIIDALMRIKWWNWPDSTIKEAIPLMNDVQSFVKEYDELWSTTN